VKYVHFKRLKATNFLSIGKKPLEITFKPGINVITGRNYDKVDRANGVGKSTITDAIHFALYGETIRELKKENIVNDQAPDALCEVDLEFSSTIAGVTKECRIIRSINPAKCHFYIDNEDVTRSGMPQTTELIVETVKTSSAVFQNSVVMSINNTVPFMAQKKIEKRKFIEGILGLEVFSNMLQLARNDYNETKKLLDVETTKLEEILRSLQDQTTQKEAYDIAKAKKLVDLQTKQANNERELAVIAQKLKELGGVNLQELEDMLLDEKTLVATVTRLEKVLGDHSARTAVAESHLKKDRKELAELEKPAKKLSITEEDATKAVKDLESQLVPLGEIDKEAPGKIKADIDQLKKGLDTIQSKIQTGTKIKAMAEGNIVACKFVLKGLKKPSKECPHCGKNVEVLGVAHFEETKASTEKNLAGFENSLAEADEALIKLRAKQTEVEKALKGLDLKQSEFFTKAQEHATLTRQLDQAKNTQLAIHLALKTLEEEVVKYKATKDKLDASIASNEAVWMESLKLAATATQDLALAVKARNNIANQIAAFNIKKQECESLTQRKNDLTFWQNGVITDIENLHKESDRYQGVIDAINVRIAASKANIVQHQERMDIVESAKFITSEEGVKSYIVKKILQVLNNRLLCYLKKLESNCIVKFNEFFEEVITNERGKECSYFNFSGAERKAIDLAMLFTFQDVRRAQADVGINLSMFDELLDSSLDEKGIELVLDILKERVDMYSEAVYIISHRKECRKYCTTGEVIFLEKRDGITTRASNYDLS
jgi:DNA repair exonuclease SbcCD ATPase subunit